MIALHQAARRHRTPGIEEVFDRRRHRILAGVVLVLAPRDLEAVEHRAAQGVEDQHAVVRGDGAAGFADDHRLRHFARTADTGDAIHHVVGVLVERVVHRRRKVGAAAVVVHAQATAHVDVLQAGAQQLEFRIHMRQLVDRILYAADVLQLAARVAVHQLQAVEHAALAQHAHHFQDLGDEQAKLALLAG